MKNELEKLLDKMDKHFAVYNNKLEFHIKRTDLIEAKLKPLKSGPFKIQDVLIGIFVGIFNLKH